MITIVCISALIASILFAGKIALGVKFSRQVKTLFQQSGNISEKLFCKSQLDGLPEPVQRYFNLVLEDGQPYISYARIKHVGQFKAGPDKGWMKITGEQYATTATPGFIWKGTTSMFVARDLYIMNKGQLVVSILSLFNVVNAKGFQYDQGELLRWLGESILYPTNFLPGDRLSWLPVDRNTAKLLFIYNSLYLSFIVHFNELGEITEMEAERYMTKNKIETWIIKASAYEQRNAIRIPTKFNVLWRLKDGDLSYANFTITEVEFNTPMKF